MLMNVITSGMTTVFPVTAILYDAHILDELATAYDDSFIKDCVRSVVETDFKHDQDGRVSALFLVNVYES